MLHRGAAGARETPPVAMGKGWRPESEFPGGSRRWPRARSVLIVNPPQALSPATRAALTMSQMASIGRQRGSLEALFASL